jgi:putative hydrolases of HD superfamily
MQTKADPPVNLLEGKTTLPLIRAYFETNQLKQLYRQGWLRRGVPPERCESVAEHTFSMAVLAMFLAGAHFPELDPLKVLRLVLLHDFGEIYAGDIVPSDEIAAEEKHRRERAAVEEVLRKLPDGESYIALWQEYEDQSTPEARFVRQIDRLDMALQSIVYERAGLIDAEDFLRSSAAVVSAPELQTILAALQPLRP